MSDNSNEQQFKIQPHPATTNNPADLQNKGDSAFAGGANIFNTPGPAILDSKIASGLEKPKSREELQEQAKKLNE